MALRINHKDNSIQFNEVVAPATPPAGTVVLYFSSADGKLYYKNDTGAVASLGIQAVVDDTSPQLGAALDVNNFAITTATETGSNAAKAILIQQADGGPDANSIFDVKIRGADNTTMTGGAAGGGSVVLEGGIGTGATFGGGITLTPGGTGGFQAPVTISGQPAATTTPILRFNEASVTGTNYVALRAPASITSNVIWTLPDDTHANANGKFITSDASGVLSFASAVVNPMAVDLDVSTFLVKASASTYLDLDDTTTTLHTAGAYTVGTVGNIAIAPDNKAGLGATTTIKAGVSTDGAGGDLTFNGGHGITTGGDIILIPGVGSTAGIVQVAGDMEVLGNVVSHLAITTEATTTRNLTLVDDGTLITCTSGSATTIQIPANASIAFPVGTQILIERAGTGTLTIAITTDTLHSAGSLVTLAAQYSTATLIKKSATVWLLAGDLA